jgi:hypothetical protein
VKCSQCGAEGLEDKAHLMVPWSNGEIDHFCNRDCVLDWMVVHEVRWKNPNPQPDVDK